MKYFTAPAVSPVVYSNRPKNHANENSTVMREGSNHLAHARFRRVQLETPPIA